ncbi:hypothetical protein DOTSEDRAFT_71504 [Dothistroma septosporum NZE10]|uniref:Solute carrier family 40 member n=1 Tax=Dothistroma septosporum (strain NZE10 / CBS 128990) TaxID=675120 RepID=N1PTU1_DOTSN|nr:hypothetical protein DOTSEDRAFT_71504 [Dothistroma septosporum NZE10]
MADCGTAVRTHEIVDHLGEASRRPGERDLSDDEDSCSDDISSSEGQSLVSFYTSHALFMWNNRSYEFVSVLLTAAAFRHTLVAASIRGLSAHLASLLFSARIGRWCTGQKSRLRPVRICIVVQRVCICLACLGWILIVEDHGGDRMGKTSLTKIVMFAVLIMLGMIERLSAVGNLIVVERDWLPLLVEPVSRDVRPSGDVWNMPKSAVAAVAEPLLPKKGRSTSLHKLNATAKRIDLVTKLVAPLAISAAAIGQNSIRYTAAMLALLQVVSCGIELYTTHLVWKAFPAMQVERDVAEFTNRPEDESAPTTVRKMVARVHGFQAYLQSPTCLPSMAYAMEPFSVLTLAGSMSTYLLIAGFRLSQITAARTASTVVELASTVLTPWLITWLSRRQRNVSGGNIPSDALQPLVKVGLIGLSWQVLCLVPATLVLVLFVDVFGSRTEHDASTLMIVLFSTLVLSRLGPFAFSLVEQQIVQLEVPAHERLEFSGVEMALIDLAELARWALLGLFGRPDQFRWVALISFFSVATSFLLFMVWAKRSRASLLTT